MEVRINPTKQEKKYKVVKFVNGKWDVHFQKESEKKYMDINGTRIEYCLTDIVHEERDDFGEDTKWLSMTCSDKSVKEAKEEILRYGREIAIRRRNYHAIKMKEEEGKIKSIEKMLKRLGVKSTE